MASVADGTLTPSQDIVSDVRNYVSLLRLLRPVYIRWQEDAKTCTTDISDYVATWVMTSQQEVISVELVAAWHVHRLLTHSYQHHLKGKHININVRHVIIHGFTPSKSSQSKSQDKTVNRPNQIPKEGPPESPAILQTGVSDLVKHIQDILSTVISFISKVQLPHFSDRVFMEKASRRLDHFKHLFHQHEGFLLIPTMDILLVLLTQEYCCNGHKMKLGQSSLYDLVKRSSTNDMTETTALWFREIRTPYLVAGSQWFQSVDLPMGHIPVARLRPEEGAVYEITINNLMVKEIWSNERGISVECRRLGESTFSYQAMFRVKGRVGDNISIRPSYDWGKTLFDLTKHRGLEFHIYGRKGHCCRYREEHISTIMLDPRKVFDDVDKQRHMQRIELPRIYKSDPKVTFDCEWHVRKSSPPSIFSLQRNPFSIASLPVDLLSFVEGLTSWDGADIRNPEIFITAQHSVHLRRSDTNLIVQVICHTRAPLAGLLLYDQKEGLLGAAHVIGDDILPHAAQVGTDCRLTIEPETDACAMLVHNCHGPWAVLTLSCDPVTDQGSYRLMLYNINKHTEVECLLNFSQQTTFSLGDLSVDLQTGRSTVAPSCEEVTEYLMTGFCVGLMYVLLHEIKNVREKSILTDSPRTIPRQVRSKMERNETLKAQKGSLTMSKLKQPRKRKRSLVCTMLLACGLEQTVRPTSLYGDSTLERMSFYSSTLSLGLLHPSDNKSFPNTPRSGFTSGTNSPRLSVGSMSLKFDQANFSVDGATIGYSAKKGIINPIYDPTGDSPTASIRGVSRSDPDEPLTAEDLADASRTENRSSDSGRGTATKELTNDLDLSKQLSQPYDIDEFINSVFEPSFTAVDLNNCDETDSIAPMTDTPPVIPDLNDQSRPDSAIGSEADDREVVFIEHM